MFPMADLGDDLFHQPQTTAETLHSDYDIRDDIFAHATSVERSGKFLPKPRINNKRNLPIPSKTCAFEGASSTSQFPDTVDGLMFPMPDLGDDLFHQRKTTAETLHSDSDIQDEIFAHATSIERSSKFLPKPHINNNKKSPMLSKTSIFEGPSSTSKFPDAADETLHSDSDIQDEIFTHATSIERSDKFIPKPHINTNKKSPMLSKTSVFEGPSSTSKFPDVADETLHSDSDIQDEIFAHTTSIERSGKFLPKPHINNNKNSPMLSKTSVFEGPSSTSKFSDDADETLHFDSAIQDEIFAHATSIERSGKFLPKPHINNNKKSPMLSKTSVFEGPSSTSKFSDVVDETLHSDSDIQDEIFAHATSIERSGKFLPKPRINNNKKSPMLSKTSVFEGPSSTIKFRDAADDAETLHSDSDIQDEIFTHATSIEKSGKFIPKPHINNNKNSPMLSKTSVFEGPSSTSKFSDVVDERSDKFLPKPRINNKNSPMLSKISVFEGPSSTSKFSDVVDVRNDLGDDLFHQPKTTTEISGKFHPMPRINKNRNPPMPSKTSASEAPSSTSKFHDIVDADEHVEKFQSEFQGITSSVSVNPVDVVSEYSQLDLLSLQNESFDAHGPNFSVGDLKARSYFPIYSSEDRACCSNINDLESQSLTENEGLAIMEGATRDHIGEPNLDECAPSIVQNDEAEKSSRKVRQGSKKLKTNIDNMAPTDQNTKNSILEMDDDYGGDGFMDDDIFKKKKRKLPKKSNSRSCENESSIKDPPKKRLQHGSSRCRSAKRQVNKALLEIPDDELDRRQLLIRDLIRLAGFKERISNKEAAALRNSFANQSTEHEQDLNGDDANGEIQQEGPRLNYHSYMRRPLQTRWSKTDTEIFYQAIRQFGTDFAMIQVLFPERSRQQVKAKFKNEQRKHPLQIADALVHRSKDHSHFEKVIEHLQAMAEQNSKNDAGDSTAQAQDEADQNEEEKMEANSKEEQDVNCFEDWDEDVHIPTKFNLSGNDFDQHSEAASEMENFWM